MEFAELLGIDRLLQQNPFTLSGGEQATVAIPLQAYSDNNLIRSSATFNDGHQANPQHFDNNNIAARTVAGTGSLPGPGGIRISAAVSSRYVNP